MSRTDRLAGRTASFLGAALAAALFLAGSAAAHTSGAGPRAATFYVGAAKANVTPSDLTNFYLGGYGIGPSHLATGVLRPIYFRVLAVRDRQGNQVVMGSLDSQGYSIAYGQGPYGFRDVEDAIQSRLGIPASHIVLQATHTHNGPDEIGVWGGVPNAYFAFVAQQMESAIEQAVAGEQPAVLKVGTADMKGYSGTFGSDDDATRTGDNHDYPMDQQLRVLQAQTPRTHQVIATLVNYSTHPTVYGPLNKVSPDWPGATATYLEADEQDMPAGTAYGYPGSTAVVTIGALGHTWPANSAPAGNAAPGPDPSPKTDDNFPADQFGNAVARKAMAAATGGSYITQAGVGGAERTVRVENTNPVLAIANTEPANGTPLGGYKIDRANTPPWVVGDVFVSKVTTLRIGDVPVFGVPGEPYPSIKASLQTDVRAPVQLVMGLAQDQLGYVEEPADYDGAFQCSVSDEWFFTISPIFGADVARLSRANAKALGLPVTGSALAYYGPDQSPSTNCTQQQLGQAPALPAG